ncbi:hypothetical protein J7337_001294 [Fusarium musae]|uniref:Uncharacterized protein n=1 Tax=Fusarium musae TaxID=1042133 RepID=A0A9P8IVU4_9HYPO|nr:hypothetical protein J7337_001294 [Fusarium musae]KAG9507739.1 hypothetical protein J7337_001294 [Fusarium musae]
MPSETIPVVFGVKNFQEEIKNTNDKREAKNHVKSVLEHYDNMKNNMPQLALDKLANFLSTENWVTCVAKPSQYRLYKILKGQGRKHQKLHFGMWMVVSAIWPNVDVVIGLADDMSKHWGVQFPGTRPWFPPSLSDDTIEDKWEGNVLEPVERKNVKKGRKSGEHEESGDEEDKSSDEESDDSDTDKKEEKRKADLLEEANVNSIPKKQKKGDKAVTVLSDDESEPGIETLKPEEMKTQLLKAQNEIAQLRGMLRAETKDKERLAKENNKWQATAQEKIAAMKKVSSENKELEDDNVKKARVIQQFKDEFRQQEDAISNNKAKNRETKAKLQDIRLKYDNSLIALEDATSKQEDTEAELKNTESKLEKSRSSEQDLQRQIVNLQQRVRGWEVAAGQANYANPATISLSIHGIATQMEDGFNQVKNAMAELAKKGQDGFDAITKEMSKKDN